MKKATNITKLEEEKLLKAYRIGFSDGVLNALNQGMMIGLIRNNRKHVRESINVGNFLNNQMRIFLKNENNRKLTIKKVSLTEKDKEEMKIKVNQKSKTEKIEVKKINKAEDKEEKK